jgi:hypothetical protein
MVVEYIRYRIQRDQAGDFEQAYARAAESLAASEYCRAWQLSHCGREKAEAL